VELILKGSYHQITTEWDFGFTMARSQIIRTIQTTETQLIKMKIFLLSAINDPHNNNSINRTQIYSQTLKASHTNSNRIHLLLLNLQ
jgi:hypothetical protein